MRLEQVLDRILVVSQLGLTMFPPELQPKQLSCTIPPLPTVLGSNPFLSWTCHTTAESAQCLNALTSQGGSRGVYTVFTTSPPPPMLCLIQQGPTFELDYLAQIAFIPDEKAAVSGKLLRFQPPDSCLSRANECQDHLEWANRTLRPTSFWRLFFSVYVLLPPLVWTPNSFPPLFLLLLLFIYLFLLICHHSRLG